MRTGLWVSGAGGSGILIARKEDGEWSPPSGILLHTAGLGFLVGVDIYDCVVVINNRKALDSFTKIRATIGGEISAVAGPAGVGGVLENDGKWKQAKYVKFATYQILQLLTRNQSPSFHLPQISRFLCGSPSRWNGHNRTDRRE
jgi:lipid-binding SYLF domain-containing protein